MEAKDIAAFVAFFLLGIAYGGILGILLRLILSLAETAMKIRMIRRVFLPSFGINGIVGTVPPYLINLIDSNETDYVFCILLFWIGLAITLIITYIIYIPRDLGTLDS